MIKYVLYRDIAKYHDDDVQLYKNTSKCTCPIVQGIDRIAKCMVFPKLVNAQRKTHYHES